MNTQKLCLDETCVFKVKYRVYIIDVIYKCINNCKFEDTIKGQRTVSEKTSRLPFCVQV